MVVGFKDHSESIESRVGRLFKGKQVRASLPQLRRPAVTLEAEDEFVEWLLTQSDVDYVEEDLPAVPEEWTMEDEIANQPPLTDDDDTNLDSEPTAVHPTEWIHPFDPETDVSHVLSLAQETHKAQPVWDLYGRGFPWEHAKLYLLGSGVTAYPEGNIPEHRLVRRPGSNIEEDNEDTDELGDEDGTSEHELRAASAMVGAPDFRFPDLVPKRGTGIVPATQLVPVRNQLAASGMSSTVAAGLTYAVDDGAKVVASAYRVTVTTLLADAMDYAVENDVLLVVPISNDEDNDYGWASDDQDRTMPVAGFELTDDEESPHAAVGGSGLLSSQPTIAGVWPSRIVDLSGPSDRLGNSYTVPMAAGVASFIRALCPWLTAEETKAIVRNTAADSNLIGEHFSEGIVDFEAAVAAAVATAGVDDVLAVPQESEWSTGDDATTITPPTSDWSNGVEVSLPPLLYGQDLLSLNPVIWASFDEVPTLAEGPIQPEEFENLAEGSLRPWPRSSTTYSFSEPLPPRSQSSIYTSGSTSFHAIRIPEEIAGFDQALTQHPVTLALWFQAEIPYEGIDAVTVFRGAVGPGQANLYHVKDGSFLTFRLIDDAGYRVLASHRLPSGTSLHDGNSHHIIVGVDVVAHDYRMWLDGVPLTNQSLSVEDEWDLSLHGQLYIDVRSGWSISDENGGWFDDLVVFDRFISDEEAITVFQNAFKPNYNFHASRVPGSNHVSLSWDSVSGSYVVERQRWDESSGDWVPDRKFIGVRSTSITDS